MKRAIGAAVLASLIAAVPPAFAGVSPRPAPTAEELTTSPYVLLNGTRNSFERIERYEYLAGVAEADRDYPRAARHFALACQARNGLGEGLDTSVCKKARMLARDHHVLDVEVYLMVTEATAQAWGLDVPGAIARVQQALTLGASLDPDSPDGSPIGGAHYLLGAIMIEAGGFDIALRELTFARDLGSAAVNPVGVAFVDTWLCRLHTQLGDFGAARAACGAAEALVPATGDDVFVKMSLGWIRANLEKALDRDEAALASLQGAWQAAQIRGAEAIRPTLMQSIADTLVTLGRLDEAERWQRQLEQAIASGLFPASYRPQTSMRRGQIAMARGNLDEAVASFKIASTSPLHEMSIGGDYALANALHARHDLPGAREALEHAIGKIEAGRTGLGGAAHRASYLTMHAKAYGELIGVLWDQQGGAAATQALELAEASRSRALLDSLALLDMAGAKAPTRHAPEVSAILDADQALIEYVSTDSRMFAVAVTHDATTLIALPGAGDSRALAARMSFFRQLVYEAARNDELIPAARRLYADLIAPVIAALPRHGQGIGTLVISPDGPLHEMPFDALLGPDGYVVDRWRVAIIPSASVLAARVRSPRRAGSALVVAAPVSAGYDPLPFTRDEAAIVADRMGRATSTVLVGDAATVAGVGGLDFQRFAVVHIASHATTDEVVPLRSALLLAAHDGNDGYWRASAIYKLHLDADLVVLSGCRTSAGTVTRGEGAMSLARAFLYAGARATVATQWDIDDAAGPAFAGAMYGRLAAGDRLVDAVGDAKRELRRRGAPPRSWAAYALTGNPGGRVDMSAGTAPGRTATRGAVGLAVAVGLSGLVLGAGALRRARRRSRDVVAATTATPGTMAGSDL
jgi:CHAT domain-containing protein